MADSFVSTPSHPSLLARIGAWISGLREDWHRITVFRRTYDELSYLSDRDLADLGISRMEIVDVAKEAAWGPSARG